IGWTTGQVPEPCCGPFAPHRGEVIGSPCGEPQTIPDDHQVWRRLRDHPDHRTWDDDLQRWLPRVGHPETALQFDPDLSTSWRQHLEIQHGLDPRAVITGTTYSLVYQVDVGSLRALELTVKHTPPDGPEGTRPIGCAHTSAYWPEGVNRARKKE